MKAKINGIECEGTPEEIAALASKINNHNISMNIHYEKPVDCIGKRVETGKIDWLFRPEVIRY